MHKKITWNISCIFQVQIEANSLLKIKKLYLPIWFWFLQRHSFRQKMFTVEENKQFGRVYSKTSFEAKENVQRVQRYRRLLIYCHGQKEEF